jgi:hypothetical protein
VRKAYPLLVELFLRHSALQAQGRCTDNNTLGFPWPLWPRLLASLLPGLKKIKALTEYPDEKVAKAGLTALVVLVANGVIPRGEALAHLRELLRGALRCNAHRDLLSAGLDLYPDEILDDWQRVFNEHVLPTCYFDDPEYLIDPTYRNPVEWGREHVLRFGLGVAEAKLRSDERFELLQVPRSNVRRLLFFEAPGHGWLRVADPPYLSELRIAAQISSYSYVDESFFTYLEEDLDRATFVEAAERAGWELEIETLYIDDGDLPWLPYPWSDDDAVKERILEVVARLKAEHGQAHNNVARHTRKKRR